MRKALEEFSISSITTSMFMPLGFSWMNWSATPTTKTFWELIFISTAGIFLNCAGNSTPMIAPTPGI